ncbi:hypothetical protein H112_01876 [Trichophyton rubrum D6]|uniref:Uncharacterized protein n=3 Tax=Trichophyton TaxID=5550 RepID=A0A080WPX3_TRIRC|nr:uncharacterized protein TERG_12434 [Trichophyton rubrum CBS 118892]EZF25861.1 hypothetical protein H100_01872 [Trichophyton rubrum MR850]EZF44838.1 hypothetical protein H102_01870 [Trichophyton rubrum CBS 100081]EZF55490.1 hypothetical protein H103_01881 [Trichophyton rubrum CBS 288.86]EZF66070.1 hypothetical protein H104_01855 [Trichophyton rubrum CBS 289.86]EZF76691.1 hypothetical protein H105_01885 [Trichophyton soudanense CBS 452.61]EZF87524.1 hypothetical protein H110_01879 [Trichophy
MTSSYVIVGQWNSSSNYLITTRRQSIISCNLFLLVNLVLFTFWTDEIRYCDIYIGNVPPSLRVRGGTSLQYPESLKAIKMATLPTKILSGFSHDMCFEFCAYLAGPEIISLTPFKTIPNIVPCHFLGFRS